MTEAEAIGAVTDLADMATTFLSLWLTVTFAYLTVAYFLGSALSRFQCLAISALYGFTATMLLLAAGFYTKATELVMHSEGGVFEELPAALMNIAWAESVYAFLAGGTLLSFYFMYNLRQHKEA